MSFWVIIIGAVIIGNFILFYSRIKKGRDVGKIATAERIATVNRHKKLLMDLDHEQEEYAMFVEKQNKTFEMFAQVRKNAELAESNAAAGSAPEAE